MRGMSGSLKLPSPICDGDIVSVTVNGGTECRNLPGRATLRPFPTDPLEHAVRTPAGRLGLGRQCTTMLQRHAEPDPGFRLHC